MAKKKSSRKTTKSESKPQAPRFEESLAELEQVVSDLESGDLQLSDSIQRYEEGVKLLRQCHTSLSHVQRKIELLTQVDEEGQATAVPFNDDETPVSQPSRRQASPTGNTKTGKTQFAKTPSGKSENANSAGDAAGKTADQQSEDVDDSGRLF